MYLIFDEDSHVVKIYISDDYSILNGTYSGLIKSGAQITY